MDLIDREALRKELAYMWYDNMNATAEDVEKRIFDAPTVAAEPVRHGKWIYLFSNSTGNVYRCSNCTKWYNPNQDDVRGFRIEEKPDYCPHCGAKMED